MDFQGSTLDAIQRRSLWPSLPCPIHSRVIDKLTYLVALAREQSFRRAAETCGVAQPTLSAGIKQLEDELGVMLVRRSSRFLGLTPEGEKVLDWARRLVGDARAMRQELQGMREGLSGTLRLAVIPTALAMVPALTASCLSRHPALRFTVLSRSSVQILEMIDNLEADAGITYLNNEFVPRLQSVPLYSERYRLITLEGTPLADCDRLDWAKLDGVPLCLLTPEMQNRRIIDRLMRAAGVEPSPIIQSDSQITLIAHVLSGRWATVLPEQMAQTLALSPQLRCIPISGETDVYDIGLVLPRREPMPMLTTALLAEARLLAQEYPR